MPGSRIEPIGKSNLLKKEFDITVEQDAKLQLLATWWNTSKAGVVRRLLTDHLESYIEAIYKEAEP